MPTNLLHLFLALFLSVSTATWAAEAYTLRTEFSKNPVYEGESVTVKFVLYGTSSFVEAEVAKFPEFRGFWTQNHVLRQGPLPLVPEPGRPVPGTRSLNQALVGSYTITPMIGRRQTQIVPMKMILRSHDFFQNNSTEEGMEIWSDKEELQVIPLPPPPPQWSKQFNGAVGSLSLMNENESVFFHADEPFSIRVSVRGTGNFADITELYFPISDRVQILSRRTFQDPTVPPTKTFEFTLVVKGNEPMELPPIGLAFFNPFAKTFELAQAPGIRLEPQPSPKLEFVEPEWFGTPVLAEISSFDWKQSIAFWAAQALIGLFFLVLLLRRGVYALARRPAAVYRARLAQEQKRVFEALESGDTKQGLREMEQLLVKASTKPGRWVRNHPQALAEIRKHWPKEPTQEAEWVFRTWDESYAPPPESPPEVSAPRLKQAAQRILKALKKPL
jgi:hypothetical protein